MNDANFAAIIKALQDAAKEDRDNLRAHIDDCIAERREARRDRHEMADRITTLAGELHGRMTRMERRATRLLLTVGGAALAMLLGIIGWMITITVKGIFLTPIGG